MCACDVQRSRHLSTYCDRFETSMQLTEQFLNRAEHNASHERQPQLLNVAIFQCLTPAAAVQTREKLPLWEHRGLVE